MLQPEKKIAKLEQKVKILEHMFEDQSRSLYLANVELQKSNKELEQFAYIASHDLQEPLRMISSYLQLLSKRYKGQLDETADEYLNFAVNGAVHLKKMIIDLLEYSRVGRQEKKIKTIESEPILRRALKNLEIAIEESGAQVDIEKLPTVLADEFQLERLFQNLISNAIKYRKTDRPLEITISATEQRSDYAFCVRDNGIGIPSEHFERIFVIFQRLHHAEEYSGTGIGLAICQKIVQNHGGRIWVESKPGKGSAFIFTLPKRPSFQAQLPNRNDLAFR